LLVERELRQVIQDHVQISFEFYYPKDQRWYETKGYPASPEPFWFFGTSPPGQSPHAATRIGQLSPSGPMSEASWFVVSCGFTLSEVEVREFRKPQVAKWLLTW
jgi:hypothetical protein